MKLRDSQSTNFSIQLVTFVAVVSGMILSSAIAVQASESLHKFHPSDHKVNLSKSFGSQAKSTRPLLIAQVWSDLNAAELSLATSNKAPTNSGVQHQGEALLITQFNQEQQQLIAQVWSELQTHHLSLATDLDHPRNSNHNSQTAIVRVPQLNHEEQQLIAQVWSDLQTNQLSLVTKEPNSVQTLAHDQRATQLSINPLGIQKQKIIAQSWSDLKQDNLSLAKPDQGLNLDPETSDNISPAQPPREPVINPPDKREIAARLALEKVQIVSPAPGVILPEGHDDTVTIQYPPQTEVSLEINGAALADSQITQQQLDPKRNLIIQTWQNAQLRQGENRLNIVAQKDGFASKTTREVLVADSAQLAQAASSSESNALPAKPPTDKPRANSQNPQQSATPLASDVKILTPTANATLERIHSSVIVQYPHGTSVILQINGESVDGGQVGSTIINPVSKFVTQTWYGVVFPPGVSTLSVLATTDRVNYVETSIQVKVPGKPEAIALEVVEAEIPADGKSVATIKGRYVDRYGTTVPWNEFLTLESNAGTFIGNDHRPEQAGFQIKPVDGEFTATLQAGYDAKQVSILAKSSHLESYTQTKFKTTLRETPLLTGFADFRLGARGVNFYDSYRDFLPLDGDNGTEFDVTAAGFILGSWGKWRYTGAFHSDRPINEDADGETRLFQTYSRSEHDYPIYGDDSSVEATTPSIDRAYLRFERSPTIEFAEPDYFMWGDYNTQEFATESQEFSGISRQLHGFKLNYNLGNLQVNGLYANNVEGFQRDSLTPDGTSGFYFLSRRLLVPGSEDIYLELTPLNDPGDVVSRQRLRFGTDYEIDYDRGTLLFSDPVFNTEINEEGDILVRRIVATYQFEGVNQDSDLFAGRGQYYFDRNPDTPSWLGGSFLTEDRGDQDFILWNVDSYISLGKWGNLTAEYAYSDNETIFANASGSAYHLAGEFRLGQNIASRTYYSQSDPGFSNNATQSFVPGQTRYGTRLDAQVSESTELNFSYEHQDNQGVAPRILTELAEFLDSETAPVPGNAFDNTLDSITAGVKQQVSAAELGLDLVWRSRNDNQPPEALERTSTQLRSRFSLPLSNKLDFNALQDLTLSDNTDTVVSDRLGLGLDWQLYSGLSLFLNHQWFTRGNLAGEALTSFGLAGEYEPWKNSKISGRYGLANNEDGMRGIGSIGLQQKVAIAPGLDLDLNYENTFNSFQNTGVGQQFTQPFAVGQSASSLGFGSGETYTIGIHYSDNPNFTADAQWQYSNKNDNSNTVWSAGITGDLSQSWAALFSFNQASSANQVFDVGTTRNIRLGLAYRNPHQDQFNALLRYEYEENGGLIPETILLGRGTGSQEHLLAGEVIYAPNWRWEFYSKLAWRNSRTFLADDFIGSSNATLGQLRATYRLNYRQDVVVEGRMFWQPSADYSESALLLETGYYLTPELRFYTGYVFGQGDDHDFTGTRTADGPYLGMTVKLNSILDGFGQHTAPTPPEGVSPKQKLKRPPQATSN